MRRVGVVFTSFALLSLAGPAWAQSVNPDLFDRFNVMVEGSFVDLATVIRLDSATLGEGTELQFEDDLGLANSEVVPAFSFEWQIGRRHHLGARWQRIDRSASHQALTEIHWGDEVIPIDADVGIGFDITAAAIDYTYYPWIKENWAAGFGIGLRVLKISGVLVVDQIELDSSADSTAPLPYLSFWYRRVLFEKWRVIAGVGWFDITVGDISGGQIIGRLAMEYLTEKRWGFGVAVNLSNVNVDWQGLYRPDGKAELSGHVDLDINDISFYLRLRFGS